MLASLQLIHMNGRIYDPVIGRFLSADPQIQFPNNLQSYNRYAYVLNNPLKYTDPSGYGIFGKIKRGLKKYGSMIVTTAFTLAGMPYVGALVGSVMNTAINGGGFKGFAMGLAIGAVAGYAGGHLAGALNSSLGLAARHLGASMIRGAITGAISGTISAAVHGQSILKSLKMGVITGVATASVIHGYRAYKTERFIDNHLQSDNTSEEFLNTIRDAGQSPVGARILSKIASEGGTLNLQLDPFDRPGNSSGIATDANGNLLLDTISYSNNDWSAGTLIHELGHTKWGGFNDVSSLNAQRASEIGAVQQFENRWNWWMGESRRGVYEGIGPQSSEYTYENGQPIFRINMGPLPIPERSLLQNLIHPGY